MMVVSGKTPAPETKAMYYRIHDTDRCSPEDLLRPEHQTSSVWVGHAERKCSACNGSGCQWEEADPDDEDDYGRSVECDHCDGVGRIEISTQDGVSVCGSLRELVAYLSERSFYASGTVVLLALEGEPVTDDEDVDAAAGALLVRPTRIVSVLRLPDEIVALAAAGTED